MRKRTIWFSVTDEDGGRRCARAGVREAQKRTLAPQVAEKAGVGARGTIRGGEIVAGLRAKASRHEERMIVQGVGPSRPIFALVNVEAGRQIECRAPEHLHARQTHKFGMWNTVMRMLMWQAVVSLMSYDVTHRYACAEYGRSQAP